MPSLRDAFELVRDFYLDGFIAAVVAAFAGGWIGTRLTLHRMPLAGLAAPQLAALGIALAALLFPGSLVPGEFSTTSTLASLACVLIGMTVLALGVGREGRAGAWAGLFFVLGWAGSSLIAGILPDPGLAEFLRAEGRILTAGRTGRNVVVAVSILTVFLLALPRRSLDAAAFDPDQARISGLRPRPLFLLELACAGVFVALAVPVLGAIPVLAMLFLPAALIVPGAGRIATLGAWAGSTAVVGVLVSFWLAVAMDWPVESTLALSVAGVAAIGALIGRVFTR